jgi:endonuclease/exonuclease/phosphatase (EEP) superfamily protein YafD
MIESGTEQEPAAAGPQDIDPLAPEVLAVRVAALGERRATVGAGALPVWDRVAAPRRRTWLSRLAHFSAWCVTLGLLAVAALRIGYHDAAVLLIWLNAFTLYVYLPAYVILAAAVGRRHWLLAAASAAVVVCHVVWVAPDFHPATPYTPVSVASAPSRPLRIFYANVRSRNREWNGILDEIAAAKPDLVVLVEVNRAWFDVLKQAQVMQPFVHGTTLGEPFMGEVMVFSKLPISSHQRTWIVGRVCNVVDIPLANAALRLFCLHSPRPHISSPLGYRVFWEKVTPLVAEQPTPLMVLGDFNATQHSLVYQRLTSLGLRAAHVDRGRGYATTWPNGRRFLPPIRIDHALVSSDVECLDITEGVGWGSDHKPLILDVRVHAAGGPASGPSAGR